MEDTFSLRVIARLHCDFTTKFGIPRQSGLVPEQRATIVFEPPFRDANALRGLSGYSHLWLIWGFSGIRQTGWSPMVKPPRLGGNKRMGVFAHPLPLPAQSPGPLLGAAPGHGAPPRPRHCLAGRRRRFDGQHPHL